MSALRAGFCAALTDKVLESLKSNGVRTVLEFLNEDLEDLSQLSAISYKDLLAIRRVILAQYGALPISGTDMYSSAVNSLAILPTGNTRMDELLDGGLYTGELTEVAGDIGTGKTQLCFSCTAAVVMNTQQNVVFVDTCGSFCAERILEMMESGHTEGQCEENLSCIQCIKAFDLIEVLTALEAVKSRLQRKADVFHQNVKLLVIDSVASIMYPILGGQLSEGQGLLVQLAQMLKTLAVEFSIAVLVSNNLVNSDSGERVAGLGRAWSHVPHTRIVLQASEGEGQANIKTARIVKSWRTVQDKMVVI